MAATQDIDPARLLPDRWSFKYYLADCGKACTPNGCPGHKTDIVAQLKVDGLTLDLALDGLTEPEFDRAQLLGLVFRFLKDEVATDVGLRERLASRLTSALPRLLSTTTVPPALDVPTGAIVLDTTLHQYRRWDGLRWRFMELVGLSDFIKHARASTAYGPSDPGTAWYVNQVNPLAATQWLEAWDGERLRPNPGWAKSVIWELA